MKNPALYTAILIISSISAGYAQTITQTANPGKGWLSVLLIIVILMLILVLYINHEIKTIAKKTQERRSEKNTRFKEYLNSLSSSQIELYLKTRSYLKKKSVKGPDQGILTSLIIAFLVCTVTPGFAQTAEVQGSLLKEGGIIITLILLAIPVLGGIILMIIKTGNFLKQYRSRQNLKEADELLEYLRNTEDEEIKTTLLKRKRALDYSLTNNELSGQLPAEDERGLLNSVNTSTPLPLVSLKKRAVQRPRIDPALSKLILWCIGTAAFWLIFGTTVGEYLGIKFVSPDADHISWLSFGRLRPVHTNAVFWGWASLGMLSLGFYVVPRVSNTSLASIRMGWWTLILVNAAVILGCLSLMAGINNGGGEYREYIWPIQMLFGIGLVLTLINFIRTIARRTTEEIYIANWYIVASVIFAIVICIVAYVPLWQDGLGETIIQGYYMHQGVGMWFMLFTLGIAYYFLPQQLNKPIYSYSLGILAFWAQILFYTVIGTHHFVFSSIPWWLQTTAIVGSMGMVIPVVAGTTNFLLTFKGAWYKISSSYTLPFFLVGIIFYFTGSLQGTAEAFRSTNLIWHFTDFTVAHSHLTMYGIISFFLWAGIYALVPRLTGKEPPQITVGVHFWLALIGLLFYTIPLMYGSTLKGLMWLEGKPFIDSVVMMAPFWLWRAIGGSLMWISHLFFVFNLYKMLSGSNTSDVIEIAMEKLNQSYTDSDTINPSQKHGILQQS